MSREERLALKKVEYEGKIYPSNRYGDVRLLNTAIVNELLLDL